MREGREQRRRNEKEGERRAVADKGGGRRLIRTITICIHQSSDFRFTDAGGPFLFDGLRRHTHEHATRIKIH